MLLNLEKYKNVFDNYTELRVQENRSFRAGFLNGNLITNNKTISFFEILLYLVIIKRC